MQIWNIKINGITNPVGFSFDTLRISYWVQDLTEEPTLTILHDGEVVYTQKLDIAQSNCTKVAFAPQMETRYDVCISCGDCCAWAYFETGTKFDAPFVTPCEKIEHPILFRDFAIEREICSARLYVTGVGLYEAYLNGEKVGKEYLILISS